ncbi:MAG: H-NS histone family protein [Porticoccaceae bacterium]|jgi:DNA-binding protein H-NS
MPIGQFIDTSQMSGVISYNMDILDQKLAERDRLEKEIDQLIKQQRKERIAAIRADIARFDLTEDELFAERATATGGKRPRAKVAAKSPVEPKYRDPETGKTWSGRGREPKWMQGRDRDEFAL